MKNRRRINILILVLISMMILVGCQVTTSQIDFSGDKLLIDFIDVGQGDSTLVMFPNQEIALIDAGTRAGRMEVVKHLQELNIKRIDYLIGTHPHEDHIGGLPEVIRSFKIGKVYLPNKINNTAIFEELLYEIKNNNLTISEGKTGVKIIDDEDLKFYIISPSKEYANINNNSIVTKIIYKEFTAIITGDAEEEAEYNMIQEGHDLKANILRVGHHGSSTSSTKEFISKVDPEYAVISLGKDNSYGHPHKEVIDLLEEKNIVSLRTDELGNISIQTDGKKITFDQKEEIYIGNLNSKIFHREDCNSLPNKENQIKFSSKEEALQEGYKPHSACIE